MKHVTLIEKSLKKVRSKFLVKKTFKGLICAIAVFSAVIFIKETVYFTDVTIYKDMITIAKITKVIEVFSSLWKDIDNVINVSENQWMKISLVEN